MIRMKRANTHTIDYIFILVVLTIFSASAFFVVFIGARQYHSVASSMSENYETRTAASYLQERLNQNDTAKSVAISDVNGYDAIVLSETVSDASYLTYIYCYNGYLWEITVSEGTKVTPGTGQKIIQAQSFSLDMVSDNLYHIYLVDGANCEQNLYVSLNTKQS